MKRAIVLVALAFAVAGVAAQERVFASSGCIERIPGPGEFLRRSGEGCGGLVTLGVRWLGVTHCPKRNHHHRNRNFGPVKSVV
jgi:hypothetical protein